MTKTPIIAILLTDMIITRKTGRLQGGKPFLFPLIFLALSACSPGERKISDPPVTPPLSRPVIGYCVVNVSYTRIMNEPSPDGVSLGYVREKTVLRVLERRLVQNGEASGYWVFVEGAHSGWLPETVVDVYDTEEKAGTAAGAWNPPPL